METTMKNAPNPKAALLLLAVVVVFMVGAGLSLVQPPLNPVLVDAVIPPYSMSVTASGEVEVPLPTDGANLPDCNELEIPGCNWQSKLRRKASGEDTVIETVLTKDGKPIGNAQVMEIHTAEYEELQILHEMGYEKAWISHIRVARAYRGNGLGRALWQASDGMIKVLVGGGKAVHIVVDHAGWGNALMAGIAQNDIVLHVSDYWAYVVK